ncbi:microtubule associated protein [Paraphaeosphaeria minitans]|uniref:Microtubule associated protein n=1 Tax=Paraphaeosphaeria minitans TaxID=565426 RepID=A0A9P6G8U7_9PLEO|nr:microtubule associated protein [Paraphaeosphaeria minitans]
MASAHDDATPSTADAPRLQSLETKPSLFQLQSALEKHESSMHDISDAEDVRSFETPDADLPPLPADEEDSFLHADNVADSQLHGNDSALMHSEMERHLMHMESSFLIDPEASVTTDAPPPAAAADDTYLFGGSPGHSRPTSKAGEGEHQAEPPTPFPDSHDSHDSHEDDSSILTNEPPTPAGAYKTPAVRRSDIADDSMDSAISTSEVMPSSPSADAARRRNRSSERTDEGQSVDEDSEDVPAAEEGAEQSEQDISVLPELPDLRSLRDYDDSRRPTSSASTVKAPPDFTATSGGDEDSYFGDRHELNTENMRLSASQAPTTALDVGKRPSFLSNRTSSQRSSLSSVTNLSNISGDNGSTVSLGADYALQSGGSAPRSSAPRNMELSRLPSLGSIASSMSGYSDTNPWDKMRSISSNSLSGLLHQDPNLEPLEEEAPGTTTPPETPRAPNVKIIPPTDTVIARHVQDIQVPDTVAREFRQKHGDSPKKRHTATPFTRNKHNLTLKEQNSKIDKLSKENFDLKLKIHFLDQALQNRSDENVQETINKNVQLQTDLANEKKENQSLRKRFRDLERRLKAHDDGAISRETISGDEEDRSDGDVSRSALEDEIEFLRERLETTETTIEQWREEALQKEADNRRMADYIRTMNEKGVVDESAGVSEAINMWKEDFENERLRREQAEGRFVQAEAERDQLLKEVQRLREEQFSQQSHHSTTNNHIKQVYSNRQLRTTITTRSNAGSDFNEQQAASSVGGTSGTLVEHLQVDNEKLQRDLHAQASMLTSRSRENQRLREENEGLRLTIRRGDVQSIAGDSILERSISRNHQRSVSRGSRDTRATQVSEPVRDQEREDLEAKCASLRDELSQTKLQYKELDDQLVGHLDLLDQTELKVQELQRELDASAEDLQALSNERDEILEGLQEKDQECEDVRQQALSTIQRLEAEIEQKEQECNRLLIELENITEDFNALQQEMKNVSESLMQLEDDRDASMRKIQHLESELDDANQELVRQDKLLSDEKAKNEKLDIQLESCQGEIDFLREEQEGDKIKIGELESTLNAARITIQDEKERHRELEERIAEERRQQEVLESREKQEVDKVITELNTQLAKLKEENRKLRKGLSSKEVEAAQWKQRLDELESDLRDALGNVNGTRASLLKDVQKLQRDLEETQQELDNSRQDLAEKDRLLRNRDALLESTGLESRRLSDMLEKERQARRQDQASFENVKRGQQSVTRAIQQHETRVLELETLRSQDRQKLHSLEKKYREELLERNNLLYAVWNRLSTLCGGEWARNNSLVNGELPSMEVISKNIQGFNKNIILAVKYVEGIIGGFRQRMRSLEKDLTRDFQTLEHTLDVRIKRLDQVEKLVRAQRDSIGRPSTVRGGVVELNTQELNKLRQENKTLRTEIQTLRAIQVTTQVSPGRSRASSPSSKRASVAATLLRHHSTSVVEGIQKQAPDHPYPQAGPLQHDEQKWIHRLKELERRLKAEREARLLDRSGARKRLEQKVEENAELRGMLERERERSGSVVQSMAGSVSASRSNLGVEEDVY